MATATPPSSKRKIVMIVEDYNDTRIVLEEVLTADGYRSCYRHATGKKPSPRWNRSSHI